MPKSRDSNRFRRHLRSLYLGQHGAAIRFQGVMVCVDLAIIAFFLFQPYLRGAASFFWIDLGIALWILADLSAQALVARRPRDWLLNPLTFADLAILTTLIWPDAFYNFAFLRAMRLWALARRPLLQVVLRRYHAVTMLDAIRAAVNLTVFLFMASGFVYTFFFTQKDGTTGFVDALYFTVTTMTTTGFGDITLPGTAGKLTSIVMMIVGISLFVRLAQALVKPFKVTFPCPQCGLSRHDTDAVHCKACGHLLNIPDEGS